MKKLLSTLLLFFSFSVSAQSTNDCCINPAWINPNALCATSWYPVIGCDNLEYANSCIAQAHGVSSWTDQYGFENTLNWDCADSPIALCTSTSGIEIFNEGIWGNTNNPCDIGECTSDGQFIEIVIDCAEEIGIPCDGEWVEVEGQCCSECVLSDNSYCDSISLNPILPLGGVWDDSVLMVSLETYFSNYSIPYAGLMLIDDIGNTIALETMSTAGNVYGIYSNMSETRELFIVNDLVFPFTGELHVVEYFFAGEPNIVCSYPITFGEIYGCTDPSANNFNLDATIDDESCEYENSPEDCWQNIQEVYIPLYLPEGWGMFGFTCLEPMNVVDAFAPIVDKLIIVKDNDGNPYLPEYDFNGLGDLIYSRGYQLKITEEILDFSFCPTPSTHFINIYVGCMSVWADNYNEIVTIDDGSCYRFGCMSDWSDNYDELATIDDGSCGILGCMSDWADNYDVLATTDDGSCQLYGCISIWADNYNAQATIDDGSCIRLGCMSIWADNYDELATTDNDACYREGCMSDLADNYDELATIDDGNCIGAEGCPYDIYLEYNPYAISYNEDLCVNIIVEGCTDNTALNYNPQANLDDESCEFIYGCIQDDADNYNEEATTDDGSCIYFGCMEPTAGNYDETANTDDGTCLIGGCMNPTAQNYYVEASIDDGSCVIYGCTLSNFPNYNPVATIGDGSCDMNSTDVYGCNDQSTWTYQDFATISNGTCIYESPKIGDLAQGGIVFYIDETGEHGLVAAFEDAGSFPWGCYGTEVIGADAISIGMGLQNTLDIVATCNQAPIAASVALSYENLGYDDWYLPSFNELIEMYNILGNGDSNENLGQFNNAVYWSSSEAGPYNQYGYISAYNVFFTLNDSAGTFGHSPKDYNRSVRPIRSF